MHHIIHLKYIRNSIIFFFFALGFTYGQITGRMPALKLQTGTNEALIGLAMLCLGVGSIIGFIFITLVHHKYNSKSILRIGSILLIFILPITAFSTTPTMLYIAFAFGGIGFSLCDVAMNTQAILFEKKIKRHCMSSIHACYSVGELAGSLCASFFAALGANLRIHFITIAILLLPGCALASKYLFQETIKKSDKKDKQRIPFIVIVFGFLAICAFVIEGSCAEWSGILLHDYKGADEATAALGFGAFSITITLFRFLGDYFREKFGDMLLMFIASLTALIGLIIVLISPIASICLVGYAIIGMGSAPLFPTIISRAGSLPNATPQQITSVIAMCGYGGLLVIPPTIGFLANSYGLPTALCMPVAFGIILLLCSRLFK